jgi:hypothetical protein
VSDDPKANDSSDPHAASVYERVERATRKVGPLVRERTPELAAALL